MDNCFNKLSAVRNVLVHKGGIADSEFVNTVKQFPEFSGISIGTRIPVDGKMIRDLVGPAIEKSIALIRAVDEWIVDHPEKHRE
jgi:hypothetical protein